MHVTEAHPRNAEFSLTPEQIRRLVRAAPTLRDQLIVELVAVTGLRRAEVRLLRVADIDFTLGRVLVRCGKGGKQRLVYVPVSFARRLQRFSRGRDVLFPGRHGGPMSLRNFNYIFARLGARAGVLHPNPRYRAINPHLLRHSLARNWKRVGGSFETLRRILGHASLKTTLDIYGTESAFDAESNYRATIRRLR